MSSATLNFVLDRVFRSNATYELVPFDRLLVDQQELLKDLTKDPDFYGVLRDIRRGDLPVKSVCRKAALLIQNMARPGRLPDFLRHSSDEESNHAIAELVLDGILEISDGDGFVSGADACSLIYSDRSSAEAQGLLPRLSRAALEYAQELSIDDAARLSIRLYNYNRLPLTPQWRSRLPSEESVLDFLGVLRAGRMKSDLSGWNFMEDNKPGQAWFEWTSRRSRPTGTSGEQIGPRREGYKLYVSPRPEDMPAAFQAVMEALAESSAHAFKVGRNAANLLRSDKLVIYFQEFAGLEQTAGVLVRKLTGCAVHGVPFTAPIGEEGLLSWGIDPVPEKGMLSWQGPESWRLWITNRLAASLVSASGQRSRAMEPWQFALERLRLEEIDVTTWTPTAAFGAAA